MLIRRTNERGCFDHGWLKTCHTFSFADYYDEKWMGFRSLRVINEDVIAPGKGFDLHGHRDMEIVTYMMRGALRHVDSMGNNEVLKAGEVQVMTAGTGIRHMEMNASQTEECHLYQIWIQPDHPNHTPRYAQKALSDLPAYATPAKAGTQKILIASPDGRDGSLPIHQDAEIWLWKLEAGETATIEVPEGKGCWMQVVDGEVEIKEQRLRASDAACLQVGADAEIRSKTELLILKV